MDENSSKRLLIKSTCVPEEAARVLSLGLRCHPLALKFLIFEVITGWFFILSIFVLFSPKLFWLSSSEMIKRIMYTKLQMKQIASNLVILSRGPWYTIQFPNISMYSSQRYAANNYNYKYTHFIACRRSSACLPGGYT